jgi:two-component system OmpR family sensor kinase/two-component system sensor histidine kinase BaeS
MRGKMIIAFAIVALAAVGSLVLILRKDTAYEVRNFINRGGMFGSSEILDSLESYYNENLTLDGAEYLILPLNNTGMHGQGGIPGRGMNMGQNLILTDQQGKVLTDSRATLAGQIIPAESLETGVKIRSHSDEIVGYLLLEGGMAVNQNAASPLLERLNSAAWQASLIAGLIALTVGLLFAWRLIIPIKKLTKAAQTLESGDLTYRVPVTGKDELSQLALAFNHMAESLEQSEINRRNMTADIAHELRTPLSVQQAQLEALQDGLYPLSMANLQPILDQTSQLARLIEDLRTLALSDAGELVLDLSPIDLIEIIRRIVDNFQSTAGVKHITIQFDHSGLESAMTNADAARFTQILHNLISNAIRFTPEGGSIHLGLIESKGIYQISIKDSGPGIPAEALPHIFDRFYRVDESRSRKDGGSGLGLAIARRLAELHNGKLTVENSKDGGAAFTLTLGKNLHE